MVEQVLVTTDQSPKTHLLPGLTGEAVAPVTADNTAMAMGSGTVAVFATPALAATPVGMTVRAEARLMTVEGRRLTFRVAAFDGVEQVGVGTHQRVIVDTERFMSRTAAKVR